MAEALPYINPTHLRFALDLGPVVGLEEFFSLTDGLGEFDRFQLLAPVYGMFGLDHKKMDTEEQEMAERYERFKAGCADIPILDSMLVWFIGTMVLNVHQRASCPVSEAESIGKLRGFAKHLKGKTGVDADRWERLAEERANNSAASMELARKRYDHFCDAVIMPLMKMKPKME